MDIELTNHRIVAQNKEGDCSEEWRGKSDYSVELNHSLFEKYGYSLFYVGGTLDIDYDRGGKVQYKCLLTYHLNDYNLMPDVEMLQDLLRSRVPIDLETMFANYDIWAPTSPLHVFGYRA